MKLLLFLLLLFAPLLHAQQDTTYPGRDVTPLLPYIFFDSGSAVIPARYEQFASPEETERFSDTTIYGNPLSLHRQMLNIIGYRLKLYPDTKITIKGHNTLQPDIGESKGIAGGRGQAVYSGSIAIGWGRPMSRF